MNTFIWAFSFCSCVWFQLVSFSAVSSVFSEFEHCRLVQPIPCIPVPRVIQPELPLKQITLFGSDGIVNKTHWNKNVIDSVLQNVLPLIVNIKKQRLQSISCVRSFIELSHVSWLYYRRIEWTTVSLFWLVTQSVVCWWTRWPASWL